MSALSGRLGRLARDMAYSATSAALDVRRLEVHDGAGIKRHMEDRGWVLVRGVFSSDEISRFRRAVLEAARARPTGDVLSDPALREVLLHERYLRVVKAVVGPRPVYFGDSNWASDYYPGTIGFHKDNPDKERQSAPDWQSPYSIFRFGVYLHDCVNFSGGLCLRDRSHHTVDVNVGQSFAVPSEPGDVVAWSHRTTHSGYATRLRVLPRVFLPLPVVARLALRDDRYVAPPALFRGLQYPERLAVFSSFGQRDHHYERYLRYLKTRQYFVRSIQASPLPPEVLARAEAAGLDVEDLHRALEHVDVSTLHRDHVPLPG
jgi:hypothetical protein